MKTAFAGDKANVGGFAWSENIGWVSFNNDAVDGVAGDGSDEDYGVEIDTTNGDLSGYAWSENIGWISFNPGDVANCPQAPCRAQVASLVAGKRQITGWARVLSVKNNSNNGNWEGWIHLNGTAQDGKAYGVYIDSNGDLHGWAWSEMVLGWLSFNGTDVDGGVPDDYKVHTDLASGPDAKIGCGGSSCAGGFCDNVDPTATWVMYPSVGDCFSCTFTVLNESEGNVQCANWKLLGTSFDVTYTGVAAKNSLTFQPNVPTGSHTLQLTVSDNENCSLGNTDTATRQINIKNEILADFECTLTDPDTATTTVLWQDCASNNFKKKVLTGEKVYLRDVSTVSEGATQVASSAWTINGVVSEGRNTSFTANKANSIRLDVVDDNPNHSNGYSGRHNCKTVTVGSRSLPKWQEAGPVGIIWQYLAANISTISTILQK